LNVTRNENLRKLAAANIRR